MYQINIIFNHHLPSRYLSNLMLIIDYYRFLDYQEYNPNRVIIVYHLVLLIKCLIYYVFMFINQNSLKLIYQVHFKF